MEQLVTPLFATMLLYYNKTTVAQLPYQDFIGMKKKTPN